MKLIKDAKGMNNRLRIGLLSCLFTGVFILIISIIFKDKVSDFLIGFCEGVSFSLLVLGGIFLLWCAIKKRNPFKPIQR